MPTPKTARAELAQLTDLHTYPTAKLRELVSLLASSTAHLLDGLDARVGRLEEAADPTPLSELLADLIGRADVEAYVSADGSTVTLRRPSPPPPPAPPSSGPSSVVSAVAVTPTGLRVARSRLDDPGSVSTGERLPYSDRNTFEEPDLSGPPEACPLRLDSSLTYVETTRLIADLLGRTGVDGAELVRLVSDALGNEQRATVEARTLRVEAEDLRGRLARAEEELRRDQRGFDQLRAAFGWDDGTDLLASARDVATMVASIAQVVRPGIGEGLGYAVQRLAETSAVVSHANSELRRELREERAAAAELRDRLAKEPPPAAPKKRRPTARRR